MDPLVRLHVLEDRLLIYPERQQQTDSNIDHSSQYQPFCTSELPSGSEWEINGGNFQDAWRNIHTQIAKINVPPVSDKIRKSVMSAMLSVLANDRVMTVIAT